MNPQPEASFVSVEEYFVGEQSSEIRHEYINGTVHAMGGASASHNLISLNLAIPLRAAARSTPCQVFIADMKVFLKIGGEDIYYYPDVLVSCDPDDRHEYFRSSPCLVIEVLSPATERIDRREKFLAYTSLASLQEYILVAQDKQLITLFRRSNNWQPELFGPGNELSLACLDVSLPAEDIYEGVELDQAASSCEYPCSRKE
jgi:Uma2 family endonuclease